MSDTLECKLALLRESLRSLGSAAVAFSGGADSALVLSVAHEVLGDRCVALTADSASLPPEELDGARRTAAAIGARLEVLRTREVEDPRYVRNAADRCYWCKSELHERAAAWASQHGYAAVVDGLNADDDPADRPGVRAAVERGVRSPLRDAGITKAEVREISRRRGLPTADKPASPCLSSRIPHGTAVTPERLRRIGDAERGLRGLGLRDLRVRLHGDDVARIEVPADDVARLVELRADVVRTVRAAGFRFVTLDLEGLRTGGANRPVAEPPVVRLSEERT